MKTTLLFSIASLVAALAPSVYADGAPVNQGAGRTRADVHAEVARSAGEFSNGWETEFYPDRVHQKSTRGRVEVPNAGADVVGNLLIDPESCREGVGASGCAGTMRKQPDAGDR